MPDKYKLRFSDIKGSVSHTLPSNSQPESILLTEPGLYCLLLRSKMKKAEPFMDWVVETILPREVRKLAQHIKDNNIQHQLAIEAKDTALELVNNDLQAIQYELERIRPRCVERRGDYDNILVPFVKNKTDEVYPYYMIRCQYRNLDKQTNMLRVKYPNMRVKGEYDDPNTVHHWVTFKKDILGKDNYHFNHFRLDGEHRDLFEGMFNIEM